jgi:PAS domain S-box-containing protein
MDQNSRSASIANIVRRLQRALTKIERDDKRPEAELRKRAEAVRTQLANVPAAVLIADNRGRYIDVNETATRLTGYSRAELLRSSVWDLTPERRKALGYRLWREFIRRERMSGTYRLRRKDGRVERFRYVAASNVLPGIHVALLVARRLGRSKPGGRRKTISVVSRRRRDAE